jgi:c-di-GMP-related signal transduction protein
MIEFIAGALCLGMAVTMIITARLLSRISKLEEQVQDLKISIVDVCRDVNLVERTLLNRIDIVDQTHTRVEDEIRQVMTGSMKSSNKRLLKG